jgi:hypothetical protein
MSDYTVLVLGAGASLPYGLPLGKGLLQKISADLPKDYNTPLSTGISTLYNDICSDPKFMASIQSMKLKEPYHALIEFNQRLLESLPKSIDEFLSRNFENANDAFQVIGKRVIARAIASGETTPTSEYENTNDDWYRYLWQECLNANSRSYDEVKSKRIRIISFNYDRSLEYYLGRKLAASYFAPPGTDFSIEKVGKWAKEGFEAIESNDFYITHPYGTLGSLTKIPYGWKNNDRDSGKEMALNINVISEVRKHSTDFSKAQEWLQGAKKVVFLGFSYDETNMERLGLSSGLPRCIQTNQSINSRQVFPLTYGLERAERLALTRKYFSDFEFEVDRPSNDYSPISETHQSMQITQYLRRYGGLTGL